MKGTQARLRYELEKLAMAGGSKLLPDGIVEQVRDNYRATLDHDDITGWYRDSETLWLEVHYMYCSDLSLWWGIEGSEVLEVEEFSLHQARDVASSPLARDYVLWRETGEGSAEHKDWLAMREATQKQESAWRDMPSIAGEKTSQPPWIKLAREDLESTSAFFAIEFASRLYPRLVGTVSYDAQLAAIRQAFVETVEAA